MNNVDKENQSGISIADAINAAANGTSNEDTSATKVTAVDLINKEDVVVGNAGEQVGDLIKNVNEEVPVAVVLTQQAAVAGLNPNAPKATALQTKQVQDSAIATMASIKESGVLVTNTAPASDVLLPELAKAFEVAKMNSTVALKSLVDYAREMHPAKPQTVATIEKNQLRLLNALYTILSTEDENFATVFKGVLAVVRANRNDAFKITMIHRGLSNISHTSIDNDTMRFLTRLIDTLQIASGLRDISQVKKQVDMQKLIGTVANPRAKKNLTNFFS